MFTVNDDAVRSAYGHYLAEQVLADIAEAPLGWLPDEIKVVVEQLPVQWMTQRLLDALQRTLEANGYVASHDELAALISWETVDEGDPELGRRIAVGLRAKFAAKIAEADLPNEPDFVSIGFGLASAGVLPWSLGMFVDGVA